MPTRSLGMVCHPCLNPLSAGVGMPPSLSQNIMNYLIIVPKYNPSLFYYDFPLGLAYISAALKKQEGVNVTCLNLNHCLYVDHAKIVAETMIKNNIDVVCTGGLITHYNIIDEILNAVKQINPNVITIVGGGLITCEPELIYDNLNVDYGVLGESDITIGELARAIAEQKEPVDVDGIIFKNSAGQVIKTDARAPIKDISSLPMPDYQGLGLDFYLDNQLPYDTSNLHGFDEPRVVPVISSRSCPFRCSFCYHPLGNKYRSRDLDEFFSEIEYLINQYDVNGFLILDELLAHSMERIEEFCRRIKPFNVRWMAQLRVDTVNEDVLKMMKESGCYYISYGIESAHDDILKSMKKNTTVAQIENALNLTYNMGISAQGNLLFSDRSETLETAQASIRWAMDHWYHRLQLTPLFALPASSDYHYALEKGIIPDKLEYIKHACQFVNISKMSKDEIRLIMATITSFSMHLLLLPQEYNITSVGYDFTRDAPVCDVTVKCPHCEKICHFRNICIYGGIINSRYLHCKYCRGRFDILIDWFDYYQNDVDTSDGTKYLDGVKQTREKYAVLSQPYMPTAVMKAPKKPENPYFIYTMQADAPSDPDRRFAIMLPMTHIHKKTAVNIGKSLADNGINACVFEIPGISDNLLQKCDKALLEDFYSREGITDTFSINASRRDLYVPTQIRHHRWLQQNAEPCDSQNTNDINWAKMASWPLNLPPATDYNRFFKASQNQSAYDAEIGITFNYIEPVPPLAANALKVVQPYIKALRKRLIETQCFVPSLENANNLLDWAESHLGRRLEGPRDKLIEYIASHSIQSIMKSELLRRLAYLSRKHQWRLKITGRYWQQIPAFKKYCVGFVGYGEPMAKFLQSCKTVIHLHGDNNVELLDILASGSFCIASEGHDEITRNSIKEFFPDDVLTKYKDDNELENILVYYIEENPEQRKKTVQAATDMVNNNFTYDSLAKTLLSR